jgi:RNA polymerase sigma-70 factor, ECF subfamily
MGTDDLAKRFDGWVADHGGAVWKIARAYTLSPEECQDLTQEIFLQLWRSLPQFEERASPATWVYRVALNTALGWQRKERSRRSRHQPLVSLADVPAAGSDSSVATANRETVERLYAAIRQLKKPEAALVLLYLDGLTYRQMSEVLGISETNVGVKLHRAKSALTALLEEPPSGPSARRGSPDPAETAGAPGCSQPGATGGVQNPV